MKASRIAQGFTAMALCAVIIASIMPLSAIAQTQDEETSSSSPYTTVYSAMKLAGEEAGAEVIIEQEQTATSIAAAINAALDTADSTVVTGSKTDMSSTLSINIPEGKKVIWKAVLTGSAASSLIYLPGEGTFEVAEGAEISASSGTAIASIPSHSSNSTVIAVSGGKVTTEGGYAIYAESYTNEGSVVTVSGGEVRAVGGSAIYVESRTNKPLAVEVSGGIVSNVGSGDNPAIFLDGYIGGNAKMEVIVRNEGKVNSSGANRSAIWNLNGHVLIQDSAEVSHEGAGGYAIMGEYITVEGGRVTSNNTALFVTKDVLVQGGVIRGNAYAIITDGASSATTIKGGSVQATGTDSCAVYANGNVRVTGGTVTASGSKGVAIYSISPLSAVVEVEGGTVNASKTAILSFKAYVRVSGGIVKGGSKGIDASFGEAVTVEGGEIEATDIGGNAIYAGGNIHIKGGTVSANQKDGIAIMALNTNVTIENGRVEAIGTGGKSVYIMGKGEMLVKGGTVKAHTTAIHTPAGNTAPITVSGGKISSGDVAILAEAGRDFTVSVTGGTIIGGRNALRLPGYMNISVIVSGGMVLSLGSKHVTGDDYATTYMHSGTPVVTSPGAVIAWNKPAGNILYGLHTAADLASLPESAAKWSRMDGKSGISCGSDGFIELDDISVVEIAANTTGLDGLQVDKAVNAAITYTLTGGSFVSGLEALDFAPEGLPEWLNITDTKIESNTVRIGLSGTPTGVREPLPLTLPEEISAACLTGGNAAISLPISGTITIGAVAKGVGSFVSPSSINTGYTEGLTLESLNSELPAGYAWDTPSTPLSAGDGQTFPATFTHPSGNYEGAGGNITVNVAKAAYTGTTTVTDSVIAGQGTTKKILTLPSLPDGASYGTLTVSGDLLYEAPSVSGTVLTYSTTSQIYGTTATITIKVSGAVNYNDYDVIVSVAATAQTPQAPQTPTSSPVIVTPPAADKPNSPTQGEIGLTGTVDSNGNITVNITDKAVTEAFDKTLAEVKKNGTEQNGITVVLRVDTGNKTGSHLRVNLPKTVQDTIIAKKIVNIVIVADSPDIRIGMDLATMQEINKQAGSDVNISASRRDNSKLTDSARTAIGSRPVFDLKVNYGDGKQVESFGAGSVSLTIPYTLGANEKAENVQAVYVDAEGEVHWLTNSVYDSVEKVLRFSTNHFSTYGIGYKQDNTAFADIAGHWAKEDIEFVVSHGLFSGTSATAFSPNAAMTRGMFVTVLGRLANADVSGYAKSSFSDVKSDAYYMGYIEWAGKNGIVNGVGNGEFLPEQSITREQMAVIMSNYAKTTGYILPKVHAENTFADNSKISTYAKEAVKQMQLAGVISGKNGNLLDPQGTATRAEVSAVLRRFVEPAISSDTMQV